MGEKVNRKLPERRNINGQMAPENNCSTSLNIGDLESKFKEKATIRNYLTPKRLTLIKKTTATSVGKDVGTKKILIRCC